MTLVRRQKIAKQLAGNTNRLGLRNSPEQRQRQSAAALRRVHPEGCPCAMCVHTAWRDPTKLAWRAYSKFLRDFEVVVAEVQFGPYRVDFLLAEEWLAVEVDGPLHANRVEQDQRRDAWLLEHHDLPTIRLSLEDIDG